MVRLRDIMPATLTFGEVTKFQKFQGLGVLPILNDAAPNIIPPLATLDEALERGVLTIREVNEAGQVQLLMVQNDGNCPVLILDGEVLTGAKQNRITSVSAIILEKTTLRLLPCCCCERGRWHYTSDRFESGKAIFPARSRSLQQESIAQSLRREGVAKSDQATVWREIDRVSELHRFRSSTANFHELREHLTRIEDFVQAIHPVPNQTGAIFFDHNGVIGAELLATPELFSKSLEKIVRSFAFDVLSAPPLNGVSAEPVKQWWSDVLGVRFSKHKSMGVGEDIRLVQENTNIVGSGLVFGGGMIHFSCFQMAGRKSKKKHRNENRSSAQARRRNMLRSSLAE